MIKWSCWLTFDNQLHFQRTSWWCVLQLIFKKGEFFLAKWLTFELKVSFIFLVRNIVISSSVKSYKGLVGQLQTASVNKRAEKPYQRGSDFTWARIQISACRHLLLKREKTIVDHRIPHNWMANWKLQILQLRDKSPFHSPPCPPVHLWPAHLQIWDGGSPPPSLFKLKAGTFWTVFHARVSVVWTHP